MSRSVRIAHAMSIKPRQEIWLNMAKRETHIDRSETCGKGKFNLIKNVQVKTED